MTKDTIIMSRPQWQESTGSNQRLRDTEEDIDSTELSYRLRMCNGFSHENSTSLINMMEEFTKNPLLKKLGAKGLKKCLPDAIMTFYMYYRGLGEILDNSTYLEKMTDLLAMYTDAEARCWYVRNNHNTDTMSLKDAYEVSSRLHTFYGTVLHNKLDQKLFLLMKCRLIKKEFKTVFNLIFENILLKTDRPSITNEVDYIRYILAYKLWKKLFKLISERKHINELAVKNIEYPELLCKLNKLNNLNSKISYILPSCPRNSKNITLFYMLHKFNVDKACVDYFVCLKNGFGEVNYDKMCSFTEDDTDYENLNSYLGKKKNLPQLINNQQVNNQHYQEINIQSFIFSIF